MKIYSVAYKIVIVCRIVCLIQINHTKIAQRLLKFCQRAKFLQIWSHCLRVVLTQKIANIMTLQSLFIYNRTGFISIILANVG